jgi:hypothetical protein
MAAQAHRLVGGHRASIGELQPAVRERYGGVLETEYMAILDGLVDTLAGCIATLHEPRCLRHCDYRLDKLLFDAPGGEIPLVVLDWQSVGAAPGVVDSPWEASIAGFVSDLTRSVWAVTIRWRGDLSSACVGRAAPVPLVPVGAGPCGADAREGAVGCSRRGRVRP